jgi:hypothetical protein
MPAVAMSCEKRRAEHLGGKATRGAVADDAVLARLFVGAGALGGV